MRAIQTRYKGYFFRSRLEARWAVFFDHLKIRWEYESEGFDLGNGLRYLPDFWLPDWGLWVEVKAGEPDNVAREKALRLCHHTGKPIFMSNGMPDNLGTLFCVYEAMMGEINFYEFVARAPWYEKVIYVTGPSEAPDFPLFETYHMRDLDPSLYLDAEKALFAARSARFEFGAKGAV